MAGVHHNLDWKGVPAMASQLTKEEREIISQMRYAGESNAAIARQLKRHRSTIGHGHDDWPDSSGTCK